MKNFIALLCMTIFLMSCGGSKKVTLTSRTERTISRPTSITKIERNTKEIIGTDAPSEVIKKPAAALSYKERVQHYIYEYAEIAKNEMKAYGIPASITLAQGILESGAGYGDLTSRAKNHFGIKCHDWEGDRVYHDDDRLQECFRKYDRASESFRDHSLFLKNRKRYARLFTFNQKDYKSWARGLREAGYATDRKYPEKLISIIERYQLYQFDDEVLGKRSRKKPPKKEAVIIAAVTNTPKGEYIVQKGDTLYSISRRHKISVQELKAFNNLENNTIKVGQLLKVATEEEEEDFD
ncbi:glucosaminidase domain-containing protein [Aquimarina sp. U1-2]|uniref:glucosaminidase domain-containing protein n=1 Tax=Aquimarina sp. U1-2 TaxID=2823141 RepID=UPI001AECEADB|nr:glucosaminidase domain-containing protein [Aquimarina sp. U1-2]MBP2831554.1 glucosaminidase domain-containing protein [Aquimarina sp. U1-2]